MRLALQNHQRPHHVVFLVFKDVAVPNIFVPANPATSGRASIMKQVLCGPPILRHHQRFAEGNHTDSATTRPIADRVMSGPDAVTIGIIPKSFQRMAPSSSTRRSNPPMGIACIRTVALQIIDDLLCREWEPAA